MPSRLSPGFTAAIGECIRPITSNGIATTSPATGPAAPTSNSASRLRIGSSIEITAPIVPKPNGSGMKYGSDAGTRRIRAAR